MKRWKAIILYAAIISLAIALSIVSLRFVRPEDCQRLCDAPERASCPSGSCRAGEQRAGLPLPVLVDNPGGSSPTGGWGILGPEDLPNPLTFVLDVLFYGALLWLAWYTIQVIRGKELLEFIAVLLPAAVVLALLLFGFLLYRPLLTR